MPTPYMKDSLTSGATKYLLSQTSVTSLVSVFPNTTTPMIFTKDDKSASYISGPAYNLKNTGYTALVVSRNGNWTGANYYNTAQYPRLSVEYFVDPIRDSVGNVLFDSNEAERRADQLYRAVDAVLHRPGGRAVMFGDVVTSLCFRLAAPIWTPILDGDGIIYGESYYGIESAN